MALWSDDYCDRCLAIAAPGARDVRKPLTIIGAAAKSRSAVALASIKVEARSRRPRHPTLATPPDLDGIRTVVQRAREDYVIARPSELHPRYGSTPHPPRSAPARRWTLDIADLRESVGDGLGRSGALIASLPRVAVALAQAARDGTDRAIPALAIAGIAILISLAMLLAIGVLLR